MDQFCMGCMEPFDDGTEKCPHCSYVRGTPPLEACHMVPGAVLAERYIIGRVLGFGGFGVTYIGYDQVLEKKIAVKEYLPGEFSTRMPNQTRLTIYSGDKAEQFEAGKEKFLDEARRLAKFQTAPEIIHVYDCFEENNTAYIVMEYLDGESLKEKLERDGPMTVEQALPIILDVLHGLEEVHKEGILHRDIAPDNIYITSEGQTKLLDFGAARFATTTHSRSLTVLIKPGYAPEEQYRSRGDQGSWTDVYATAATFYRMITGEVPQDAMERAAKDRVKNPSRLGIKIGPNTEAALMNAMNVAIEGRTQTAREFEEELLANVVKRVIVKKQTADIGKWPLWIKLAAAGGVAGIGLFAVLVTAGVIRFDIAGWSGSSLPEGKTRVPNVVNEEMETAVQRGQEVQLTVQVYDKQYSSEIPADKVLSQNLKGGSVVDVNETLGIVISAGIEKTYVPNVRGVEKEEALNRLKDAGLVVSIKEEPYRAAPGTIGWQSLEPGTETDTGTSIEIILSQGIQGGDASILEVVDDICGMDYEEASEQMIEKYLYLVTADTQYSDKAPAGAVISQSVKPGSRLAQNSNVEVVVSLGRELVMVPDVQYKTEEEAVRLLEESGLEAEIRQESNAEVQAGNVIRQDTESGEQAEKGATVVIYISTGAPVNRQDNRNPGGGQNGGYQPPADVPTQTESTWMGPGQFEPTAPAPTQPQPTLPWPGQFEPTAPAPTQPPETAPPQPPAAQSDIWDIIGD